MFEKILLAFDGSEESKRATEVARDLATLSKGEVLVYHVVEREVGHAGVFELETPDEATEIVDAAVGTLKDGGISARGEVNRGIHGRAAKEILAEAKSFGAGIVVMGSRGRSELSGMLVGSVAHKVIHLADCPVVVVR